MLGSVWEFPRSRLRLQTVLGEGNFGKVWKAEADDICGYDGTILVAVKTVKVITQNILAPVFRQCSTSPVYLVSEYEFVTQTQSHQ